MTSERTAVTFKPFLGGFVLETLTVGMYGEARNAIREYIQNGFDSICFAIKEMQILAPGDGLIEIEFSADRDSLTIRDNGAGLRVKSATTILTKVGASNKDHRIHAGFRGIGRLAGIVFSDTVVFTTKAKGECEQTTVIFDGKTLRAAMAPGSTKSNRSIFDLMNESVKAFRMPVAETNAHFFEVKLQGFTNPPSECVSIEEMYDFVSQIAPVPYSADFPFRDKLAEGVETSGIPVEEVNIVIKGGDQDRRPVTKRYGCRYKLDTEEIVLTDCALYFSKTGAWWAWVGKKKKSGAYNDIRVGGLRVRVRNIQIDGTAILRQLFQDQGQSYGRFQDYFVGEMFIKPSVLVPNARRDGFEDDATWRRIREEIIQVVVKELIKEAYDVSRKGLYSVTTLRKNLRKLKQEFGKLQKSDFATVNDVITLSKRITTYQKRIPNALLDAGLETAAELQAIGSELSDLKQTTLIQITGATHTLDREQVQQEAQEEMLKDILVVLEDNLSPRCYSEARAALLEEFGDNGQRSVDGD